MHKSYKTKGQYSGYRCWKDHPPLVLTVDGQECHLAGGSSVDHDGGSAEIFVSLDRGAKFTERRFPWREGEEVHYPITDMSVPKNAKEFIKMVSWLSERALEGRSIYVGCIGGHGRTGLVLAALVKTLTGEVDAVQYVRDHYCKKAVESDAQCNWLHKHFGIQKRKGTKMNISTQSWKPTTAAWGELGSLPTAPQYGPKATELGIAPMKIEGCIHGENI